MSGGRPGRIGVDGDKIILPWQKASGIVFKPARFMIKSVSECDFVSEKMSFIRWKLRPAARA